MDVNHKIAQEAEHGIIRSRKGGMLLGAKVVIEDYGHSLLEDLLGQKTYFQILLLHVTGRMWEKRVADWLEALFLCVSYPDDRIWCNQIGSLAATMGASPVAAVSVGILASDSRLYGPGTQRMGVEFIRWAVEQKRKGKTAQEVVAAFAKKDATGVPLIPGYARPLVGGKDERIEALERVSEQLGFEKGEHLTCAYGIDAVMRDEYGKGMNALGYSVAFLADLGMSGEEQYRLVSAMVQSGVLACYSEWADRPVESFLPLRCDDIEYTGIPSRQVPK